MQELWKASRRAFTESGCSAVSHSRPAGRLDDFSALLGLVARTFSTAPWFSFFGVPSTAASPSTSTTTALALAAATSIAGGSMLVHEVSRFIAPAAQKCAARSASRRVRSLEKRWRCWKNASSAPDTYLMSAGATSSRGHWRRRGRYPPRLSRDDVLREPASRPSRRDALLARVSRASRLVKRPDRPGSPRRDPHRRRGIISSRSSRSDVVVRNPSRGRDALVAARVRAARTEPARSAGPRAAQGRGAVPAAAR